MNKSDFLEKFSKDVIKSKEILSEDTFLLELDEWDSLTMLTTISFLDKELNLTFDFTTIGNFNTISDILDACNIK